MIVEVLRPGTYNLKDGKGRTLANTLNIKKLRRFYPYQDSNVPQIYLPRPQQRLRDRVPVGVTCRIVQNY